jgi:mutator protein MutT
MRSCCGGGEVLLARRSPRRKAYGGLWSFPGGHVEVGETFEEALVRESREEIGILPIAYVALGFIADPNTPAASPATYHLYAVNSWEGGEPAIMDNEHTALEWFTLGAAVELGDLALEEYRRLFRKLMLERS